MTQLCKSGISFGSCVLPGVRDEGTRRLHFMLFLLPHRNTEA